MDYLTRNNIKIGSIFREKKENGAIFMVTKIEECAPLMSFSDIELYELRLDNEEKIKNSRDYSMEFLTRVYLAHDIKKYYLFIK